MMRLLCSVALVVATAGSLELRGFAQDTDTGDKKKLEGTWSCVSAEKDGKLFGTEIVKTLGLTLGADRYTTRRNKTILFDGNYRLDSTKKPREIDLIVVDGPQKGDVAKGIYELDKDTLKLCYGGSGNDRPKAFTTKENSGLFLIVWKKTK